MTENRRQFRLTPLIWVPAFFCAFYIAYFSPALIQGKLLGPGDGHRFYFSAFEMPWRLWEPGILSGYPVFADPQFFLWYPLKWLIPTYNAFIIGAYVIGSSAMFGFVISKTGSIAGGLAAAIVFGTSSFTIGHLGHASILHAAIWMPFVAWSIDRYAETRSRLWFAAGAVSISLCVLSGHPQIALYVLMLAGAMALRNILFAFSENGRSAFNLTVAYGLMVFLGLALCSMQLVPFIQLGQASGRAANWNFSDFASYSLPLRQLPSIFVPYLYGGRPGSPAGYFGDWNLAEILCFAGTGTLLLIGIAVQSRQKRDGALFWSFVLVVALLLCTVGQNGIGWLIYEIPVLGSFRAQGRAGILFVFAVAMLAGIGIARLQERAASGATIIATSIALTVLTGVAVWSSVRSDAWNDALHRVNLSAWFTAPDIVIAFLFIFLTTAVLALVRRYGRSIYPAIALLCILTADISRFGWYHEWFYGPQTSSTLSAFWQDVRSDVMKTGGRILVLTDNPFKSSPLAPNLNLNYGIDSANGYGPLEPIEYRNATGIDSDGLLTSPPGKALLTALAVSKIIYPTSMPLQFGVCGQPSPSRTFTLRLSERIQAREIRVVSYLACSIGRRDGEVALTVDVESDGRVQALPLLVGRDTSDWTYDFPGVSNALTHSRAEIHSSTVQEAGMLHDYLGKVVVSKSGLPVQSVSVTSPENADGILVVKSVELLDTDGKATSIDLPQIMLGENGTPNPAKDGFAAASATDTFQGMYWLVNDWVSMPTRTAEAVVRNGKLPDGVDFDPTSLAITEDELPPPGAAEGPGAGVVSLVSREAGKLTFNVESKRDALLFISQSFHDGWNATVNGTDVTVHRTNGAFQGVMVPAGKSVVELRFRPQSLMVGILLSLAAVLALLLILAKPALQHLLRGHRRLQAHPAVGR